MNHRRLCGVLWIASVLLTESRAEPAGAAAALESYLRALASLDGEKAAELSMLSQIPYVLDWKVLRWEDASAGQRSGSPLESPTSATRVLDELRQQLGPAETACTSARARMEQAISDWRSVFGNVSEATALAKQDELIKESRRECDRYDQLRGQVAETTSKVTYLAAFCQKSLGRSAVAEDTVDTASAILDIGLQSRGGLRLVKKHRAILSRLVSEETHGRWIVTALSEL